MTESHGGPGHAEGTASAVEVATLLANLVDT